MGSAAQAVAVKEPFSTSSQAASPPGGRCLYVNEIDVNNPNDASPIIQFSRGCPFSCEFCHMTVLFGHKASLKSPHKFIRELDYLYNAGWRDNISNAGFTFIGIEYRMKRA